MPTSGGTTCTGSNQSSMICDDRDCTGITAKLPNKFNGSTNYLAYQIEGILASLSHNMCCS